jgi:sugar/nucleoside kinase (ribokinase family)
VANVAPPKQGIEAGVGTNQPLAAANALPATLAPVAGVQGLQALYYGAPNVALKPDAPATSLQVVVDASKLPTDYVVSLGTDQRVNPKLIRDVLLLCHYTAA